MRNKQKLDEKLLLKEINTFAEVAICTATMHVAKHAIIDANALVRGVRFTRLPVTIRGRIAIQPVGGSVRRFRS